MIINVFNILIKVYYYRIYYKDNLNRD